MHHQGASIVDMMGNRPLTKVDRARIRLEYKLIDRLGQTAWDELRPCLKDLEWEIRKEVSRIELANREKALTERSRKPAVLPQFNTSWTF